MPFFLTKNAKTHTSRCFLRLFAQAAWIFFGKSYFRIWFFVISKKTALLWTASKKEFRCLQNRPRAGDVANFFREAKKETVSHDAKVLGRQNIM